jgi:hypothetical protein
MILKLSHGHAVMLNKVDAILDYGSNPLKTLAVTAGKEGKLINATGGRKTRSLVVLTSGHIVSTSVDAKTLISRLE